MPSGLLGWLNNLVSAFRGIGKSISSAVNSAQQVGRQIGVHPANEGDVLGAATRGAEEIIRAVESPDAGLLQPITQRENINPITGSTYLPEELKPISTDLIQTWPGELSKKYRVEVEIGHWSESGKWSRTGYMTMQFDARPTYADMNETAVDMLDRTMRDYDPTIAIRTFLPYQRGGR